MVSYIYKQFLNVFIVQNLIKRPGRPAVPRPMPRSINEADIETSGGGEPSTSAGINTNQTGGGEPSTSANVASSSRRRTRSSTAIRVRTQNYYNNNVTCVDIELDYPEVSVQNFVRENRETIVPQLITNNTKIQFKVKCNYYKAVNDAQVEKSWFVSNKAVPYSPNFLSEGAQKLDEKIANYASGSSGWIVRNIETCSFCCVKFVNVMRLNGQSFVRTPAKVYNKKCCINVKNKDNFCFLYALLSVWKYDEVREYYRHEPEEYKNFFSLLKYKESDMPMKINSIPKFERQNPQFRINILKYLDDDEQVDDNLDEMLEVYKNPHFDLLYRSQNKNSITIPINLLIVEGVNNFHYLGIRNMSRLLNIRSNIPTRIQGKWCENCFRCFRLQQTYDKHLNLCKSNTLKNVLYTMPENKELKFTDWSKTIPPAYIAIADFESLLKPNGNGQLHTPLAVGVLIIPGIEHEAAFEATYKCFFGEDCVVQFLEYLEDMGKCIKAWYETHTNKPMVLSEVENEAFGQASSCYLCKTNIEGVKHRDHDHFTGRFLGATCASCNLARRIRKPFLPVIFHNFKGYDLHHIMKYGLSNMKHWRSTCIPQSSEKFLSLHSYIKGSVSLRFLDSLQFMNASLGNLVSILSDDRFVYTNSLQLPQYIIRRKGVFPYSYITDMEKLNEGLPSMEAFNDLIQSITYADYEHAQNTYRDCECNSLKDYMLLYLKLDVYLLADVFCEFRSASHQEDGLEPCNYYSIPGMSWDSALNSIGNKELHLLQDSSMYEFFEYGVRGGMTFVNKHYIDNSNGEILYIDINNLYGYALSEKLPCRDFEWVLEESILKELINNLPGDNDDIGYVLEVDLHIPAEYHNYLKDLPPAPCKQKPPGSSTEKLLLTLEDKQHYVIHYRLLKYYLSLGVQVTQVHRAVKFFQDTIFSNYIACNTQKRASTTHKFLKDFYKLKNNSLFGKTVENLRKRMNLRLVTNERQLLSYSSKPTFQRIKMIDEDFAALTLGKETICLNRPVYVGQAILDISKLRMYKLNYTELQKYRDQFACEIEIVAGDTDSFFLHCRGVSVADQLLPTMLSDELLDSSNFDCTHPLYSNRFTNQIGKFKDETGQKFKIIEGVFLRPKCYSLKTDQDDEIKKAKGVTYKTVKDSLAHEHYLHMYYAYDPKADDDEYDGMPTKRFCVEQTTIRSINHQLKTVTASKVALSCMDDKRLWIDANTSLPYGHCDIA